MPSTTNNVPLLLPNACTAHGIVSGGQPNEAALRDAAERGFKTIINLQTETEEGVAAERSLASELGLVYIAIPVAGASGISRDNAARLDHALADAAKPVIVHCAGGNRVGALMALRAFFHQGLSETDALAVGVETGLRSLEAVVKPLLKAGREDAG